VLILGIAFVRLEMERKSRRLKQVKQAKMVKRRSRRLEWPAGGRAAPLGEEEEDEGGRGSEHEHHGHGHGHEKRRSRHSSKKYSRRSRGYPQGAMKEEIYAKGELENVQAAGAAGEEPVYARGELEDVDREADDDDDHDEEVQVQADCGSGRVDATYGILPAGSGSEVSVAGSKGSCYMELEVQESNQTSPLSSTGSP